MYLGSEFLLYSAEKYIHLQDDACHGVDYRHSVCPLGHTRRRARPLPLTATPRRRRVDIFLSWSHVLQRGRGRYKQLAALGGGQDTSVGRGPDNACVLLLRAHELLRRRALLYCRCSYRGDSV